MKLGDVVHVSVGQGGREPRVCCRPALVWDARERDGGTLLLWVASCGGGYVRALARGEPGAAGTWHSAGDGCGYGG